MKTFSRTLAMLFLASLLCGFGAVTPANSFEACSLECVLKEMDEAAANFHTTQADFVWDQYQKVVDETDTQKGTVYFRRVGNEIQMAADITDPTSPKYVLFTDSKVEVYQPKIDQGTRYTTGKDRAPVESFLVLGLGG